MHKIQDATTTSVEETEEIYSSWRNVSKANSWLIKIDGSSLEARTTSSLSLDGLHFTEPFANDDEPLCLWDEFYYVHFFSCLNFWKALIGKFLHSYANFLANSFSTILYILLSWKVLSSFQRVQLSFLQWFQSGAQLFLWRHEEHSLFFTSIVKPSLLMIIDQKCST